MISVIVPVYNTQKQYLRECVESILNQTLDRVELILVDDGSDEECAQYIEQLAMEDERCKIFHTLNKGVSAARNMGLQKSRGEYIAFVDSDDWLEKDYLMNLMNGIGDCDLSILRHRRSDQKDISKKSTTGECVICANRNYIINSIMGYSPDSENWMLNSVWGKLYRRDLIFKRNVKFDIELKRLEDVTFNLQYFLDDGVSLSFIDNIGYNLRIHSASTVCRYCPDLGENLIRPLEKMKQLLCHAGYCELASQALAYRTLLNCIIYINDGVFTSANNRSKTQLIKTFFESEVIQDLLDRANPDKLNFTQKFIIYCVTRRMYHLIWLYYQIKVVTYKHGQYKKER